MTDATRASARRSRRWMRPLGLTALLCLFGVEFALGWPALEGAFSQLRTPDPGWTAAALAAELASMGAYARMQRRLLRSTGLGVPIRHHLALTYAAHSLSVTLPGGPAFSTRFNYQQMRRFGATPGVASWCIALSGILSAIALAVVTVAVALAAHGTPPWRTLLGLTLAALVITLAVHRVSRRPQLVEPALSAALVRINRFRGRSEGQRHERVARLLRQLKAARLAPRDAVLAALFAVLNWLLDAFCFWLSLHAVGVSTIGMAQVMLAYCAGMAAASIPLIPGGLGIIDSALVLGLVTGGVSSSTAVAAVVLYRLISLGFIISAGWVTWLVIRTRVRSDRDAAQFGAHPPGGRRRGDDQATAAATWRS